MILGEFPGRCTQCNNMPHHPGHHTGAHATRVNHTQGGRGTPWKRHQHKHRPQWLSQYSDPMQHAQGRMGDCPGPVKKQQPDGPHALRNTGRQVADNQNAKGSGQQRPRSEPRSNQHNPSMPTTERSEPTQHAKGRASDCPGPRKELATRRNLTEGVVRAPRWRGGGGG